MEQPENTNSIIYQISIYERITTWAQQHNFKDGVHF